MDLKGLKRIHFIGAGGAGISALMKLMLDYGIRVCGSDLKLNARTRELESLGAQIYEGEDPDAVSGSDLLVYTSAASKDNAELRRAESLGIPVLERHEFLGAVADNFPSVIAVSGTHGKTTVTAMLAHIFKINGRKFSALIGGDAVGYGNYASSSGVGEDTLIAEACEYKRGLLSIKPTVAVVTNVELDHPDCYKKFDDLRGVFKQFLKHSRARVLGGSAFNVLYGDKCAFAHMSEGESERWEILPNFADVTSNLGERRGELLDPDGGIYKVFSDSGMYICGNKQNGDRGKQLSENSYTIISGGKSYNLELNISCACAAENAAVAIAAAHEAGISIADSCAALSTFAGVKRRFEEVGIFKGARIIFDFAHHPTELCEALKTAKNSGRTLTVFQPHTYSRTAEYLDAFAAVLSGADSLILMPTYGAREECGQGVGTDGLYAAVKAADPHLALCEVFSREETADLVKELAGNFDVVLFLGAGDIYELSSLFKGNR